MGRKGHRAQLRLQAWRNTGMIHRVIGSFFWKKLTIIFKGKSHQFQGKTNMITETIGSFFPWRSPALLIGSLV